MPIAYYADCADPDAERFVVMKNVILLAVAALGACASSGCAADENTDDPTDESNDEVKAAAAGVRVGSEIRAGGLCAPSLADGAVPEKHKALLDTIAFTEGTRGKGDDGYNVLDAHRYWMTTCDRHPNFLQRAKNSTAAGRYQFLHRTWAGLGYANFGAANQDKAGMRLVTNVRRVTVPTDAAMTDTQFRNALDRLSYEWASLPPFRYSGQGQASYSTVRREYCRLAGC